MTAPSKAIAKRLQEIDRASHGHSSSRRRSSKSKSSKSTELSDEEKAYNTQISDHLDALYTVWAEATGSIRPG